ncbi:RNA polymerase sigma factor [Propionibacteriaceae bacterium Y1923]|uniref:RNA polymerase sigma factor n=1 Tax=Aestuariimicrobium sp. Y1814 TaxID=3418742 RepID=UPI003C13FE08
MPLTRDDRLLLTRLTRPDRATVTDDAALVVLVTMAQGGDEEAGERVLSAMAFRLAAMARASQQTTLAQFVSAAWFVISGFNPARNHKVLTNLVLDCLKQVTRDRVSRWDERTISHPDPDLWDLPTRPSPTGRPERAEARAALDEARHLQLIDERTHQVLDAVYLGGLSSREAAARLGVNPDQVRYRCSRALRTLREHQRELCTQ